MLHSKKWWCNFNLQNQELLSGNLTWEWDIISIPRGGVFRCHARDRTKWQHTLTDIYIYNYLFIYIYIYINEIKMASTYALHFQLYPPGQWLRGACSVVDCHGPEESQFTIWVPKGLEKHVGVSMHGSTPIMLDGLSKGRSICKWMITRGTLMYGNTHVCSCWYACALVKTYISELCLPITLSDTWYIVPMGHLPRSNWGSVLDHIHSEARMQIPHRLPLWRSKHPQSQPCHSRCFLKVS